MPEPTLPTPPLVQHLADHITRLTRQRQRTLVAVDGPDCAGKTTLADALARLIPGFTLRASIDGFHRPREERVRRGELSPQGYYRDSFDEWELRSRLLSPFRAGKATVANRLFDFHADRTVDGAITEVPPRATLLFDGVFLLRPTLRPAWDFTVFLSVPEEVTLARALTRDVELFGSPQEVERRYRHRYLPGQALYRSEASPTDHADVVIENSAPAEPVLRVWRS